MRYFKAMESRVVGRYGAPGSYIAARYERPSKDGSWAGGFRQDLEKVTAIPDAEAKRNRRNYYDAVRHGDLTEVTQADFDAYQAALAAKAATALAAKEATVLAAEQATKEAAEQAGEQAAADGAPAAPPPEPAPELDSAPAVESEPKAKPAKRKRARN